MGRSIFFPGMEEKNPIEMSEKSGNCEAGAQDLSGIGETTAGPQHATFYGQPVADQALRAYHGDPAVKAKYIARMRAHQEADELIRGTYCWKGGKGGAIGCTVHSDNHVAYETELGMPEWFALLEDDIFVGMSKAASYRFPMDILSAIPVGFAAWDNLYHKFCAYILRDVCKFDRTTFPDVAAAVDAIVRLHEQMTESDEQAWSAARLAAYESALTARSAADTAEMTAGLAADAAEMTAGLAADAAEMTAGLAAESAIWAARSAAFAAEESALTARSATLAAGPAADMAALAARSTAFAAEKSAFTARLTAEMTALAVRLTEESAAYDRMGNWLVRRFDAADGSR